METDPNAKDFPRSIFNHVCHGFALCCVHAVSPFGEWIAAASDKFIEADFALVQFYRLGGASEHPNIDCVFHGFPLEESNTATGTK
jgi:hypothetical protein